MIGDHGKEMGYKQKPSPLVPGGERFCSANDLQKGSPFIFYMKPFNPYVRSCFYVMLFGFLYFWWLVVLIITVIMALSVKS